MKLERPDHRSWVLVATILIAVAAAIYGVTRGLGLSARRAEPEVPAPAAAAPSTRLAEPATGSKNEAPSSNGAQSPSGSTAAPVSPKEPARRDNRGTVAASAGSKRPSAPASPATVTDTRTEAATDPGRSGSRPTEARPAPARGPAEAAGEGSPASTTPKTAGAQPIAGASPSLPSVLPGSPGREGATTPNEPLPGRARDASPPAPAPGGVPIPAPRDESPTEPSSPALVRMILDASEARVGDRVTLRVVIENARDVGSVPFYVAFDPAVLRFEGGQQGPFLGSDGRQAVFFASLTSSGDTVVIGLSRLGPGDGIHGAGELCALQFTAIGAGDSRLAFAREKVRDSANRIVPGVFQTAPLRIR